MTCRAGYVAPSVGNNDPSKRAKRESVTVSLFDKIAHVPTHTAAATKPAAAPKPPEQHTVGSAAANQKVLEGHLNPDGTRDAGRTSPRPKDLNLSDLTHEARLAVKG